MGNSMNSGDSIAMAVALLDVAIFFQTATWNLLWVVERLYHSALENAKLIEHDDQRTITLIRYLYGRFLFEQS